MARSENRGKSTNKIWLCQIFQTLLSILPASLLHCGPLGTSLEASEIWIDTQNPNHDSQTITMDESKP